jgi:hypothetical protein
MGVILGENNGDQAKLKRPFDLALKMDGSFFLALLSRLNDWG